MATTKRLTEVYEILGRVLNNPACFGLGSRAPEALVDVLTTARQKLMEDITEQKGCLEEEEDLLEAELSQDADTCMATARNR